VARLPRFPGDTRTCREPARSDFKLLHDEGVPAEKLARVRAPIGLDFGSSTPQEIALGIMAEITLLRHGGTGKAMSEPLRERFMERLRRLDDAN
jgi:xanthine/CO dehydrogenase XdhC/CoxF family maturation factor